MPDADPVLLLIAGANRSALLAELQRHRTMAVDELVALPLQRPSEAKSERVAIVAAPSLLHNSLSFALERLPTLKATRWVARAQGIYFAAGADPGRVAFLFPGQGSEHVGMLQELSARVPAVRAWFDALDRAAAAESQPPITALIAGGASTTETVDAESSRRGLFDMERGAQLGTTADLAMHDVALALGLRADVHVGHSNGEHAAVIAAGRVPTADRDALCRGFVRLGRAGARLQAPTVPERLIAVSMLRRDRLSALVGDNGAEPRYLAMDNCPNQTVLGGTAAAMDAAAREVQAGGGMVLALPFSRAYHTPLFADWAATFAAYYDELPFGPGRVSVFSCCTAQPLPDDPNACRETMAAQWTTQVRFSATIDALYDAGVRTFVEIGPSNRLTAFVEDILRGRRHLAVSTSSPHRGEVEQLFHLAAELFVAGALAEPARLARLLGGAAPAQSHARAELDVRTLGAQVHARLAAEARANLARASAAVRARLGEQPAARPSPAAAGEWPLLGDVTHAEPARLRAVRTFTRRADPFVDDHALGRLGAGWPGSPLPVLPFTLCVEMACEAARRLTGAPAQELRDVRASRWLALDAGELTVTADAETEHEQIRVRLADAHASPAPAFEAAVSMRESSSAAAVARLDPEARQPQRWDARSFYERYAFHGPGFRGLSNVTAIDPHGIDAELRITANAGLPLTSLTLDPAMLDCAGQLVAFWLLEQTRRPPTFGIFPFAARRISVHRAPLDAGATVRCRGAIQFDRSTTLASFVFTAEDGSAIAAIDGLAQRLVDFPDWLAACIFAGDRSDKILPPAPGSLSDADRELLTGSWGIWARALAHLCLRPEDFAEWRTLRLPQEERVQWLLSRVARRPYGAADIREPIGDRGSS